MADEEAKRQRDRSPSFPFISLDAALGRARDFYAEEKRGSAPYEVAASHWHYSPASSGALQTVAALKQYGLMSDEGSGKQRRVRLTDVALRIILDQREDSTERINYMRQAARTPTVIADIYEKWPEGLPSEQTLKHFLVIERQFNEATAARAVRILKENEAFTGMLGDRMLSELEKYGEDSMSGQSLTVSGGRSRMMSDSPTIARVSVSEALQERQIEGRRARSFGSLAASPNCTISLLADGPVTQDGLKKLIKYVELIQDSFPKSESSPESAALEQQPA